MQIIITLQPDGQTQLSTTEDCPWLVVKILRQLADTLIEQMAAKEAQAKLAAASEQIEMGSPAQVAAALAARNGLGKK